MGRAPCCDKANVKRGAWSPEEDSILKSYIEEFGTGGNWIALPQKIGLKRCGKSCRLRWLNYLRPNIKHGGFSEEEDAIICNLYMSIGSRWSIIAGQLPGRTDNDVKNHWNTKLKKKLLGKQRKDPRPRSSSSVSSKKRQNLVTSEDMNLCNNIRHQQIMFLQAVHGATIEPQVHFHDRQSFSNFLYVEGTISGDDDHHQNQSYGNFYISNSIPDSFSTNLNSYENMYSSASFNSNYSYHAISEHLGVPYSPVDMVNNRSTITSSSASPASSNTSWQGDMTNNLTYSPSMGYNYQIYPETIPQGFMFQESSRFTMQQQTVLQQ